MGYSDAYVVPVRADAAPRVASGHGCCWTTGLIGADRPMKDDTTQTQTEQTPPANEQRSGQRDTPYMVVLSGVRAGEMFRLCKPATLLGRSEDADVRLADDGVSRRHAMLMTDGATVMLKDLSSANGTFCNGTRIGEPVQLADGDKISIGGTTILKFTYQDALEEQFNRQLYESAVRDGLTRVYNRRYFDDRLTAEMTYALRHGTSLALMMADVDHFKRVNDERGHQVGDATLREVARRLSLTIRGEDVLARYGGEEFAILCRDMEEAQARTLAERLRRAVAHELSPDGPAFQLTISIGIAVGPAMGVENAAELVSAADAALYQAKRQGRNRAVAFDLRPSTDRIAK
jgi:two-component system, cell cycle response regulator